MRNLISHAQSNIFLFQPIDYNVVLHMWGII